MIFMTNAIETRADVLLRPLEIAGWVTLILLLPLDLEFARHGAWFGAFLIPVGCALALRFEGTGLRILAWAGLPFLLPVSFDLYNGRASYYLAALAVAWLTVRRRDIHKLLPGTLTWRLAGLVALLPLYLSLDAGFLGFRINLELFSYLLVMALAAGGAAAGPILGLVALLCAIGAALDAVGLRGELGADFGMTGDLVERIYFAYGLNTPRDLIVAAILFFLTRYLMSFDRDAARSLVGRRLPPKWARLALIAALTLYAAEWDMNFALARASGWELSIFGSSYVLWMTAILAGFYLGGWGALFMTGVILVCHVFPEPERLSIDVGELLVPVGFHWIGTFWRRHTRGDMPATGLLRWGLAGSVAALMLAKVLAGLGGNAVIPVVFLWVCMVLFVYLLTIPRPAFARYRRVVTGPLLDLTTFALVISLCYAFWQQIIGAALMVRRFYDALIGMEAFDDGAEFVLGLLFSVVVSTGALLGVTVVFGRLTLAALKLWPEIVALLRRRSLTLDPAHAGDHALRLILDRWAAAPTVPKIMRALGSVSVLTLLAASIAFAQIAGEVEWGEIFTDFEEEPLILEEPPLVGDEPVVEPSDDRF